MLALHPPALVMAGGPEAARQAQLLAEAFDAGSAPAVGRAAVFLRPGGRSPERWGEPSSG